MLSANQPIIEQVPPNTIGLEMEKLNLRKFCADTLNCHEGITHKKSLNIVTDDIIEKLPELKLTKEHRLCKQCRKKFHEMARNRKTPPTSSGDSNDSDQVSSHSECEMLELEEHPAFTSYEYELKSLNDSLQAVGWCTELSLTNPMVYRFDARYPEIVL